MASSLPEENGRSDEEDDDEELEEKCPVTSNPEPEGKHLILQSRSLSLTDDENCLEMKRYRFKLFLKLLLKLLELCIDLLRLLL